MCSNCGGEKHHSKLHNGKCIGGCGGQVKRFNRTLISQDDLLAVFERARKYARDFNLPAAYGGDGLAEGIIQVFNDIERRDRCGKPVQLAPAQTRAPAQGSLNSAQLHSIELKSKLAALKKEADELRASVQLLTLQLAIEKKKRAEILETSLQLTEKLRLANNWTVKKQLKRAPQPLNRTSCKKCGMVTMSRSSWYLNEGICKSCREGAK